MRLSERDRLDLLDLAARYALYADRRELGALAGLFTEDGALVLPEPPASLAAITRHEGRGRIELALAALHDVPVTGHAVLGHVIDEQPGHGTASGTVTGTAAHVTDRPDGQSRNLIWHVHYRDRYRRGPDGWRFHTRELDIDWIETRPVRLRGQGGQDRRRGR
ncbi:nuclear transport factor 2 family protein [Saccharomonospora sp. NPDC006951]